MLVLIKSKYFINSLVDCYSKRYVLLFVEQQQNGFAVTIFTQSISALNNKHSSNKSQHFLPLNASYCYDQPQYSMTTVRLLTQYNKYMQSKAAQILRALNSQIQHQPQPQPQPPIIEPSEPPLQASQQQSLLTSQIIESKMPKTIFNAKMKYEQNRQAPQCLTEILEKQIGSLLHENVCENIECMLREREKNAYDSYTKGENEYLSILLEQVKRKDVSHMDFVSNLMSARLNKVEGDLKKGNLVVNHDRNISNRKQFERLQQLDLARMIRIKDGELRSKMDILHDKMQEFDNISSWHLQQPQDLSQQITKKAIQIVDTRSFDLTSQRTKMAKQFAHEMQLQRLEHQKKRRERRARYEQEEKERQAELKEAEEVKDIERHEEILRRIEAKRKKREEEQKQEQGKEDQARRLLAEYRHKLPVFKAKEKEFEQRVVKPEQQYREQKLREIREYRKSMSLNQIKQHESKYLSKLETEKSKREEEFKLIMKSRQSQAKRRYYRGSAHARMEQMTKEEVLHSESMREASKVKAHRMKEYSHLIHQKHQPVVDEDKKNELLKLMEREMMRKKRARKIFKQIVDESTQQIRFEPYYQELPQKDLKQEGNKFFLQAKKHIKRKEKPSPVEQIEQLEATSAKPKSPPLHTPNPKKERSVWEIRSKKLKEIASSEVSDAKNFEYVKLNIENLDGKAAVREGMMEKVGLGGEEEMREKALLEEYYMESIRQKMKLLD